MWYPNLILVNFTFFGTLLINSSVVMNWFGILRFIIVPSFVFSRLLLATCRPQNIMDIFSTCCNAMIELWPCQIGYIFLFEEGTLTHIVLFQSLIPRIDQSRIIPNLILTEGFDFLLLRLTNDGSENHTNDPVFREESIDLVRLKQIFCLRCKMLPSPLISSPGSFPLFSVGSDE